MNQTLDEKWRKYCIKKYGRKTWNKAQQIYHLHLALDKLARMQESRILGADQK